MQKLNHSDDIIVSAIKIEDAGSFYSVLKENYAHLHTYFPITLSAISSIKTAEEFIAQKIKKANIRQAFYFVLLKENNIAGVLSVKYINWLQRKAEIAYFVTAKFEGRGIGSAGIAWLTQFCFAELQLKKIFAKINPGNIASKKVIEKNGFSFEELLKKDYYNDLGELTDSLCYAKVKM